MAQIRLDFSELTRVKNRLEHFGQQVTGAKRRILADIGEAMVGSVDDRFRDQRDPDGNEWQPLSPAYKKRKRNKDKILIENGTLRRSIHAEVEGDSRVIVGSGMEYSAVHQYGGAVHQERRLRTQTLRHGTKSKSKGRLLSKRSRAASRSTTVTYVAPMRNIRIPRRSFLGISAGDREVIDGIVEKHLKRLLGG